ncbi:peptidase [Oceanimonas baumannii]|uniref:Membrane protein YqiK n=1 Tax=Oceanimonas baumannii TaxID=129578 RepID=A0A235CDW9_9GAMM|nr:peptidase [Oceanimonas baumannii]OYD22619.1 peptidase [Oceanimonas baumannii]TDW57623.1 putative membrane protein YqiK [Oceanimonas baumannii]
MRVAKLFTTQGGSQLDRLKEHFQPKFSEALKTAVKQFEFEELLTNRREFRDAVVGVIGSEMDGFKIYDVVIDKVDQTSFDAHDPQNILDVEGIRKIAAITSSKNIETNAIRQDEQTLMRQKDVEAENNRAQLDKQEQENQARVKREIEIIRAQEEALAEEKRQEYISQKELARLQTEENVAKRQESMQMEVELTRSSNERQVAIQQEEVNRAKETERVRTEREIAQQTMEKEAALEESRKAVVETRSQRVEIERKIAREEEETANLRAFQQVERDKKVKLTEAEAGAEAEGIRTVALARAEKQAAAEWVEKQTLESEAQIKIRTREAENELHVKTREAEAELIRDTKRAEAKERMAHALREEISAEGLAQVEVDRERAQAIRETGEAEAAAVSSLGLAEAQSHQAKGDAEAQALRAKGLAEAEAQTARFEAAKKFDDQTREHDKWVLELQQKKDLEIARIDAQKSMSVDSAKALATALSAADIKLFGGQGMEELRRTVMNSAMLDTRIGTSEVLKPLVREYTEEGRSLSDDIRAVLENSQIDTGSVSNLALAKLLTNLNGNGNLQEKLQQLVTGDANRD